VVVGRLKTHNLKETEMTGLFVVGIDSDGHFMIADANDRSKIYSLLKRLSDGNFLKNLHFSGVQSVPNEQELISMNTAEYYAFMAKVQTKRLVEMVMP
jgi:hypothetical protein